MEITFWYWWIAALLFVIAEMFVPGVVFLWMATSAGIVGGALWLFPGMSWELQLTLFAVLTIVSVVAWRYFIHPNDNETDQPKLNRRGAQYIGRRFTLEQPIVNGIGTLKVDDTTWRVRGPDTPAGVTITVTATDGMELITSNE